jgi:hypothetical protein
MRLSGGHRQRPVLREMMADREWREPRSESGVRTAKVKHISQIRACGRKWSPNPWLPSGTPHPQPLQFYSFVLKDSLPRQDRAARSMDLQNLASICPPLRHSPGRGMGIDLLLFVGDVLNKSAIEIIFCFLLSDVTYIQVFPWNSFR